MDLKTEFTNQVINACLTDFSTEQLQKMKMALDLNLYHYDLSLRDLSKELPICVDDYNGELLEKYYVSRIVKGMAKSSLSLYNYKLKVFAQEFPNSKLTELSADDIRYYLARLKSLNKHSGTTLNNTRLVLNSFYNWLVDEEYITKNPISKIETIKNDTFKEEPFTQGEFELLCNECTNTRDRALIEFLLSTGCRVSEAINVNTKQLDFENKQLTIIGKGNKQRTVYLSDRSIVYLNIYLKNRNDNDPSLFVSVKAPHHRLTSDGVNSVLKTLGEKAGIVNVHPHRFRRTMCCNLINKGVPIQDVQVIMGHSDIGTTMIYYNNTNNNVKYNFQKVNNI